MLQGIQFSRGSQVFSLCVCSPDVYGFKGRIRRLLWFHRALSCLGKHVTPSSSTLCYEAYFNNQLEQEASQYMYSVSQLHYVHKNTQQSYKTKIHMQILSSIWMVKCAPYILSPRFPNIFMFPRLFCLVEYDANAVDSIPMLRPAHRMHNIVYQSTGCLFVCHNYYGN